ncbi:MAG TPA: histone deacetylase [Xenococcaceae cyanobacterium]|jgi:acetoin utilization deacetylase AcuC-like enzyme
MNHQQLTIIYSDRFLEHKTGYGHPERPERLTAIVQALQQVTWQKQLEWRSPSQRNPLPYIEQIHTPEHINRIARVAAKGGGYLESDTPISSQSYDVALLAVAAWLDGIDAVLAQQNPAFVIARPPGHHATKDQAMGFCLFSNAAIAACYALEQPGINRVAILDWDVHHGNGTEAIVQDYPNLAYCSLHQHPCYPGTGSKSDRGIYNNILNLPVFPGSDIHDYQSLFEQEVMPFLKTFKPDLLIVSAGYDANHHDLIAEISLQPSDYGLLTQYLTQITNLILFGLEGGYDLDTLGQSVVATLASCL